MNIKVEICTKKKLEKYEQFASIFLSVIWYRNE